MNHQVMAVEAAKQPAARKMSLRVSCRVLLPLNIRCCFCIRAVCADSGQVKSFFAASQPVGKTKCWFSAQCKVLVEQGEMIQAGKFLFKTPNSFCHSDEGGKQYVLERPNHGCVSLREKPGQVDLKIPASGGFGPWKRYYFLVIPRYEESGLHLRTSPGFGARLAPDSSCVGMTKGVWAFGKILFCQRRGGLFRFGFFDFRGFLPGKQICGAGFVEFKQELHAFGLGGKRLRTVGQVHGLVQFVVRLY